MVASVGIVLTATFGVLWQFPILVQLGVVVSLGVLRGRLLTSSHLGWRSRWHSMPVTAPFKVRGHPSPIELISERLPAPIPT